MQKKKIYSKDLGIDLKKGEREIFKWFLACLLFGKPIQQEVAKRTYFEFEKEGLISEEKILEAGWDKLVEILDRGHYVRYDFSTATKLQDICKNLREKGGLLSIIKKAKNKKDLGIELQKLKGIGSLTARIFLRDLKIKCQKVI